MYQALLRIQKVKPLAKLSSRSSHNLRYNLAAAPNADPERRDLNRVYVGPEHAPDVTKSFVDRLALLPRYRKDAVLAVEIMMSASTSFFASDRPNFNAEATAWAVESRKWLVDTFTKQNLISLVLHMDEEVPHLHALIIPVDDGKLCASRWLDGPAKMKALQTSYAAAVGVANLQRADMHSKSRHVSPSSGRSLRECLEDVPAAVRKSSNLLKLPKRDQFGVVSDQDWIALQADVSRTNDELLMERSNNAAAERIRDSELGKELLRRRTNERKRVEAAEWARLLAEQETANVVFRLSELRGDRDTSLAALKDLWDDRKRLETARDNLVREIQELQGEHDREMRRESKG